MCQHGLLAGKRINSLHAFLFNKPAKRLKFNSKIFPREEKMKKLKSLVPLLSLSTGWQTKIDFSVTFKFSSNLNGSNYGSILRFRYKLVL